MTQPDDADAVLVASIDDNARGTWLVHTTWGSTYYVNMTRRFVARIPLEGNGMRRDGEPLPLRELVQCDVGAGAIFVLDVRGDGVPTYRRTSDVIKIEALSAATDPKASP